MFLRMIDILHDQPVGVAKARLAADRGHLDRLQLLGARLLKHGKDRLQGLDLDGQTGRLKRPAGGSRAVPR